MRHNDVNIIIQPPKVVTSGSVIILSVALNRISTVNETQRRLVTHAIYTMFYGGMSACTEKRKNVQKLHELAEKSCYPS